MADKVRLIVFLAWVVTVAFTAATTLPGLIVTVVLMVGLAALQSSFLLQMNGALIALIILAETSLVWIFFWTGAWLWYYKLRRP